MPPVVIAGGIAAAGAIGAAAISSSSAKKAANSAANTELQVAQQNNALAREVRDQNIGYFRPYMATGNQAMRTLNGLLFAPQLSPQAGGVTTNALDPSIVDPNAQNSWDQFRNGTNYQWRLGQGFNALNQGLAAQGALRSGAAQKSAIRYGQNFASNELGNYINLLQGQQNLGFGGAQALAGVGNVYVNQASQNNQNAADAAANAALLRGQASGQLIGTAANALGNFASSFGQSYKPPAASYAAPFLPTWSGSGNAPYYVGGGF